jgi:hypothetical protein
VTNEALKSVEHHTATNLARARTSVATFVGPVEKFVGEASPLF